MSLLCSPKRWIITTLSWLLSSHISIDYKHEGSWRLQGTTIVGIRLVFVYHRFFINEGSSDKRLPRKQEKYNFWITDFNAIYYCPIARRARLSSHYTYYAKHQPRDSMGFEPMSFNKVYRKYVNLLTCTY